MKEYEINHRAHGEKINNIQITNYKQYTISNTQITKTTALNKPNKTEKFTEEGK
jgi:hypothetical protein